MFQNKRNSYDHQKEHFFWSFEFSYLWDFSPLFTNVNLQILQFKLFLAKKEKTRFKTVT